MDDGKIRTYIILNLNKLYEIGELDLSDLLETDPDEPPHPNYITRFSVFEKALNFVTDNLGVTPDEYRIIRADLKFDSEDPDFYAKYEKLHRYILLGFISAYDLWNEYKSTLITAPQNISASVREKHFQIESYDKSRESQGRDPSAARFEIRSVGMSSGMDLQHEFQKVWRERFQKAAAALSDLEKVKKLTEPLIQSLDKKTLNKNKAATLCRIEDYLYCPEQIELIADRLNWELKNPKNFIAVWKKRYDEKLYSKRDVQAAIDEIFRAMESFFDD